jgi:hypothetical protein
MGLMLRRSARPLSAPGWRVFVELIEQDRQLIKKWIGTGCFPSRFHAAFAFYLIIYINNQRHVNAFFFDEDFVRRARF